MRTVLIAALVAVGASGMADEIKLPPAVADSDLGRAIRARWMSRMLVTMPFSPLQLSLALTGWDRYFGAGPWQQVYRQLWGDLPDELRP